MNTEQKKAVTKWLGECWHEKPVDRLYYPSCYCKLCGNYIDDWAYLERERRTFTDPADFFAVWERLGERKSLGIFFDWAEEQFLLCPIDVDEYENASYETDFKRWLLSKETDGTYRLCSLVAEWAAKQQP